MQALLGAGGTKIPAQRRLLGCSFCWLSPVLAAWGRQVPVAICADLGLPWLPAIWQLHLQPSAHPPAQVTTAPCCGPTHLVGRGGPEAAPPAGGLPPPPSPSGLAPPPPTLLSHLPGPFSPPLPGVQPCRLLWSPEGQLLLPFWVWRPHARGKSALLLLSCRFFKHLMSACSMFVNSLLVLFLKYLIVSGFCGYNQRLNRKMHSCSHVSDHILQRSPQCA